MSLRPRSFCFVSDAERAALTSIRRPIVILRRRPDAPLSQALAPGNNTLGVMLPYTPLHHLLFGDSLLSAALVMTSGNLSEEPIVTGNREAAPAPAVASPTRSCSTIATFIPAWTIPSCAFSTDQERVLRRSRGYAPHPVTLSFPIAEILACGAELKNTFCLTKDHHAFLSQHIGDLENYETLVFFHETLDRMQAALPHRAHAPSPTICIRSISAPSWRSR